MSNSATPKKLKHLAPVGARRRSSTDNVTRERIIQGSLELFNQRGEQRVTTNHIAAHLEISPGNLYYYFRNKEEIIFEIYQRLEHQLLKSLELPSDRPLALEDITAYLGKVLTILWHYRFFFRELSMLCARIPKLHLRYSTLVNEGMASSRAIYNSLVHENIMQATPAQIDALTQNSWIVATYWFTFLETREHSEVLTREQGRQGIMQVVALFYPFLLPEAQSFIDAALPEIAPPDGAL